ncbi:helix-turn-helix domain-containing protein [Streptomyces sp. NPDC054866]
MCVSVLNCPVFTRDNGGARNVRRGSPRTGSPCGGSPQGSVVGAAAEPHVTQSAATLSLHDLEDTLGVTLFERGRRGASTSAGVTWCLVGMYGISLAGAVALFRTVPETAPGAAVLAREGADA